MARVLRWYTSVVQMGKKGLTIEGIDYVNIDGKLQTNDDRLLTTSKDICRRGYQ